MAGLHAYTGRETLVEGLEIRLRHEPLVPLCGPIGAGKSAIARHVSQSWTAGSAIVELSAVAEDTRARAVIGEALDALGEGGLLVLDAVDSLGQHLDDVCRWVLETRGDARLLLTLRSQRPVLNAATLFVAPLPIGRAADGPASTLFDVVLERVTGGQCTTPPEDEVRWLILQATDGLPLLIERLVDLWWMLGPKRLLDQLRPLLGGDLPSEAVKGVAGLPVEWVDPAWRLLTPEQQDALVELSIVPGAFEMDDAEALLGEDAAARVSELARANLLRLEGPGRFRLYRLVRAYAGMEQRRRDPDDHGNERYATWILDHGERFYDAGRLPSAPHRGVDLATLFAIVDWAGDRYPALADRASTLLMYYWDEPVPAFDPVAHAASRIGDEVRPRFFRAVDQAIGGDQDKALMEMRGVLAQAEKPWVRVVLLNWLGSQAALSPLSQSQREARAYYKRASDECLRLGVDWKRAHCLSCLAGLLQFEGDLEGALALYDEALPIQAREAHKGHHAYNLSDRSRALAELGRYDESRRASDRAIRIHAENGYVGFEALALADRGLIELHAGQLEAAEEMLNQAILRCALGAEDPILLTRIHGRRAAVRAERGDLAGAQRSLAEARRWCASSDQGERLPTLGWERPIMSHLLRLYGAFVEVAEGGAGEALGILDEEVEEGIAPPSRRNDEIRMLETLLRAKSQGGLWIAQDGARFSLEDGAVTEIERFRAAQRILAALATQRVRAPGIGLDTDALFEAGWPDTVIDPIASQNRVYAELSRLRKLGLKGIIQRVETGYLLDPAVPVSRTARTRL